MLLNSTSRAPPALPLEMSCGSYAPLSLPHTFTTDFYVRMVFFSLCLGPSKTCVYKITYRYVMYNLNLIENICTFDWFKVNVKELKCVIELFSLSLIASLVWNLLNHIFEFCFDLFIYQRPQSINQLYIKYMPCILKEFCLV